jgi:4-hydroxy-tetrahydrodipicolinate synthase
VADDFAIYSGDDATAREAILAGANGDISVTANVAPAAMHAMCAAALAGDAAKAAEIDANLAGLHRELFAESNPIPVKWALAEMQRIEAGIRLPLTWFSAEYHDQLRAAMQQAGIL